jgi:hypothetical protein
LSLDDKVVKRSVQGGKRMQPEHLPPVGSQPGTPPYNDVFIDTLVQRLTPPLTQKVVATRTKLAGMSLALALVSLVVLACLTYLFLSMGTAGISAAGVQLGSGLGPAQQLLGIGLTSLAVVLVNAAIDFLVFKTRR